MDQGAKRWLSLVADWLDYGSHVHFMFYEEVRADPEQELRLLLRHLGLTEQEDRLGCIVDRQRETFHRSKGEVADPFRNRPDLRGKVITHLKTPEIT